MKSDAFIIIEKLNWYVQLKLDSFSSPDIFIHKSNDYIVA